MGFELEINEDGLIPQSFINASVDIVLTLVSSFLVLALLSALLGLIILTPIHVRYYRSLRKNNLLNAASFAKDVFIYSIVLIRFAFIYLLSLRGFMLSLYIYTLVILLMRFGWGSLMSILSLNAISIFNVLYLLMFCPLLFISVAVLYRLYNCRKEAKIRLSDPEYIDSGREEIGYSLETYHENLNDMGYLNRYLGADYAALTLGFEKFLGKPFTEELNETVGDDSENLARDGSRESLESNDENNTKLSKKSRNQRQHLLQKEQLNTYNTQGTTTILDVGCGGGWMTRLLSFTFKNTKVTGVDTGKDAIDFAKAITAKQSAFSNRLENATFKLLPTPKLSYANNSFDIVTTTLVCHHIHPESELIEFFEKAFAICRKGIVISDLERDFIPLFLFKTFICGLKSNPLTQHDGYLSIRRAFTEEDWERILSKANIRQYAKIVWTPALRWIIIIEKPSDL